MSLAVDDAGLPDEPEFRSAFVADVEWGTRLALHNSQPGAPVAELASDVSPETKDQCDRSPVAPPIRKPCKRVRPAEEPRYATRR